MPEPGPIPVPGIALTDEAYEGKTILEILSQYFDVTSQYFTEYMFPFIIIPDGYFDRFEAGYEPIA